MKKIKNILWIGIFILVSLPLLIPNGVLGQGKEVAFPTKPITLVVPYSVGGGTDVQARLVASYLEKKLIQPVVVENKTGGGGAIGHREVKMANPDGYKILCSMFPDGAIQVAIKGKSLGFANEDFITMAAYSSTPGALSVKKGSSLKNMADFVEFAKKNPEKLTVAIAGQAWLLQVFDIEDAFNIKLNPVMFKGGGEVINALLGGHVMAIVAGGHFVIPGPEKGMVPLAITGGTKRFEKWPNAPLMKELGHDISYEMRRMFCAPKGTPESVVQRLTESFMALDKDPDFVGKMKGMGELYKPSFGAELQKYYNEMCDKINLRVEKRRKDFVD